MKPILSPIYIEESNKRVIFPQSIKLCRKYIHPEKCFVESTKISIDPYLNEKLCQANQIFVAVKTNKQTNKQKTVKIQTELHRYNDLKSRR